MRRLFSLTSTATLVVAIASCSGATHKTATTTVGATTSTAVTPPSSSTSTAASTTTTGVITATTDIGPTTTSSHAAKPVDNETFAQIVDAENAKLDAAGKDACKLQAIVLGQFDLPDPSTTVQAKTAAAVIVRLFTAIADAAPADQAVSANAWRAAANYLTTFAKRADFSADRLVHSLKLDTVAGFAAANDAFDKATSSCPGAKN